MPIIIYHGTCHDTFKPLGHAAKIQWITKYHTITTLTIRPCDLCYIKHKCRPYLDYSEVYNYFLQMTWILPFLCLCLLSSLPVSTAFTTFIFKPILQQSYLMFPFIIISTCDFHGRITNDATDGGGAWSQWARACLRWLLTFLLRKWIRQMKKPQWDMKETHIDTIVKRHKITTKQLERLSKWVKRGAKNTIWREGAMCYRKQTLKK